MYTHTIRHTTGRTPLNELSAGRKRPLPDNTQQTQATNIRVPGGIRNRNPNNKGASTFALDCTTTENDFSQKITRNSITFIFVLDYKTHGSFIILRRDASCWKFRDVSKDIGGRG
jgi:hypothetical protein